MSRLPSISGRRTVAAFERGGWSVVRVGSSRHIILKKEGVPTALSIPDHAALDRGLLRSLIRDAGLSTEGFTELLGRT